MQYDRHVCAECDRDVKDCACFRDDGFGPDEDAFDFVDDIDDGDEDEIFDPEEDSE